MSVDLLKGVGVALATPLNLDYSVDFTSLEQLVTHVLDGGVDYMVVQGTTGESPVFGWKEKLDVLEFIVQKVDNRKPIVFGLGGNNTLDLIEQSKDLFPFELAAILSVSPYYNKPSQKGIINHYQLLADEFPHPIILYNVPSRTASNMLAETTLELSEHANIIGMKEASGNMEQCQEIINHKPSDFLVLSGDDANTLELMERGADGVISVIANLVPKAFGEMVYNAAENDKSASIQNAHLKKVFELSMEEGNPSSIKAGLEAIGIGTRTVKPPLYPASDELVKKWETMLKTQ